LNGNWVLDAEQSESYKDAVRVAKDQIIAGAADNRIATLQSNQLISSVIANNRVCYGIAFTIGCIGIISFSQNEVFYIRKS
jgi:hypothetical protein